MNASPGLIHMVQEALNSPMGHAPAEEYGKWTIQELACWIMGFEHAMRMVEGYINVARQKPVEKLKPRPFNWEDME